MPAVITIHNEINNDVKFNPKQAEENQIQKIVTTITDLLLRDNPQMVAEVEAKAIDRLVLEVEVLRIIDKSDYSSYDRDVLVERVIDYMFGYGPIQYLVDDETISDIDFTRYNMCIIKRSGIKIEEPIGFKDERSFESFVKHIITRKGGNINENYSHCRVSDHAKRLRINGSIWPRNISGAALQIRKHPLISYTFKDLVRLKMMNEELADLFDRLSKSRANIFITGMGAAGKTTVLRAIVNAFKRLEKVLLCEKDTEIYPDNPAVIVQSIKKKTEGGREVTLVDLINDGLTMTLETYVIGEMVSEEAWPTLEAGLNGTRILSSGHASSARKSFQRLITLCKRAKIDLSEATLMSMFANSLDIIVHMKLFKVYEILEVIGFNEDTHQVITNKIYEFKEDYIDSDGILHGEFGPIGEFKGRHKNDIEKRGC